MTGVRYGDLGFEGFCKTCGRWFPISAEFWPAQKRTVINGVRTATRVTTCRSCIADRKHRERLTRQERARIRNRDWMRAYRARMAA